MSDATTPEPDAAAPMEAAAQPVLVHGCPAVESLGQVVVHPSREQYVDIIKALADEGYAMCVENVGWNYATPSDQLDAWRASPGHNRNLLDVRVTHAGIAVAGEYVTLIACR